MGRVASAVLATLLGVACPGVAFAQSAVVTGRVVDAAAGTPIAGATLSVEGTPISTLSDESGRFRLRAIPPGPQVIRAIAIGYAPLRHPIVVPPGGELVIELSMARSALKLPGIMVVADPAGRARGELGTASVIESEAIRNQTAASIAGLLELVPGTVLQPPGLDGVQQFGLRSVPISAGAGGAGSADAINPTAQQIASFGTQIVLDGVPLSNNANLQSLGPRGELSFSSSAGGGIDLRRLPATTVERIEVIRGLPSVRYGDLTQGAVIIETRAGAVDPELRFRYDARTLEGTGLGGLALGREHTATANLNLARTRIAPGETDDIGSRWALQLAHRFQSARLRLDTRIDGFQLLEDRPPVERNPDLTSRTRETGLRLSERFRLRWNDTRTLEIIAALEGLRQRSFAQSPRFRAAMPFTDRITEGRQIGKFIGGGYVSRVDLEGDPRHVFTRAEYAAPATWFGLDHALRAGLELRREWNGGAGYQFDIEFPPQVEFNGVQGFDRPRRFDALPALVTTGLYLDDRLTRELGGTRLSVQAGLRLDMLHDGGSWFSGARDYAFQPRLQVELAPWDHMRFRGGAGRLAKVPPLASLYPALQYNDLVNVNYYANEPSERLAVLTTRILDRTNQDLRMSSADKAEIGVEWDLGREGMLAVVGFVERTNGAVGVSPEPTFLLRERFAIDSATIVPGQPPGYLEPAFAVDTVPVLIDRPANNLDLRGRGIEVVAIVPEIVPLHTRIAIQGAWTWSEVRNRSVEFGVRFSDFQLGGLATRAPYWDGTTRTGDRLVITTRLIHHQPRVGLLITGTFQVIARERRQNVSATDTLAFAGYITRLGELVPVPADQRTRPEFADLRRPRVGIIGDLQRGPADWLFSLQVSKTLPLDGRLSFYAFNAFDRLGNFGDRTTVGRINPPLRYGLEVTIPLGLRWGGR